MPGHCLGNFFHALLYFLCLYRLHDFFLFFFCFRTAYRAEVATFVVPVAGEQSSDARLRERIDFTSNILFFIEDLYLAVGTGLITTKSGVKLNMASSLLWVRNQLAGSVKELMIAKKTGWKVLQNLKQQVFILKDNFTFIFCYVCYFNEPLDGVDSFDVLLDPNDSVFDPHPGFQHRFVGLYSMKLDKFRPRSTCRHVDPAKLGPV